MGFGDFTEICERAQLPLCSLVGGSQGLEATCYARNIELANTMIFQVATDFVHLGALVMLAIMIFHVRQKYTAVGRKEILHFFFMFMALTILSLLLDAGVIPPSSPVYAYFVAIQCGLASATVWCLLINGFIGFQFAEDGTPASLWFLRSTSAASFTLTFVISLFTFQSWASFDNTKTMALFIVLYILNAVFLAIYSVLQVVLVLNTLEDRWPLGDLAFGVFFLIAGQVLLYAFSADICEGAQHYIDGLFLATLCNLLSVMMVYKYWDSLTKEDLEFSISTKATSWEVKELLPEDGYAAPYGSNYGSEYGSTHALNTRMSTAYHNGYGY
ncbi:Chitin synthase, class 7 [Saitoella coloradoensis]